MSYVKKGRRYRYPFHTMNVGQVEIMKASHCRFRNTVYARGTDLGFVFSCVKVGDNVFRVERKA